jgi:hypothetical protein
MRFVLARIAERDYSLGMDAANTTDLLRRRYETACETWLTVWGWESLAVDLEAAARRATGERRQQLLDRAADCRARCHRQHLAAEMALSLAADCDL